MKPVWPTVFSGEEQLPQDAPNPTSLAPGSSDPQTPPLGPILKKTTGLVGLAVCETPHERLKILYTKILDVLGHIPKNAAYRKYTEQITNEKLSIVKAEPDVKKLEEQLQGGQIEEVILQGTGMQKEELKRYLE